MPNVLSQYNTIGTLPGIFHFAKVVLSNSSITIKNIEALCSFNDSFSIQIKGAIAFFSFLGLSTLKGNYVFRESKGEEFLGYLSDEDTFHNKFSILCLNSILHEGIISPDAITFDIDSQLYLIRPFGFSLKHAIFRNILLEYNVLKVSPKGGWFLHSSFEAIYSQYQKQIAKKVSIEELKKRLEEQQIRGDRAENFVCEFEYLRLHNSLKPKRISEIDVSAGYDIVSYNNIDSFCYDRFIEVKSFVKNIHFFWSQNEKNKALILGEKYYIYLVDVSKIDEKGYKPIIISNPCVNILSSSNWIKEVDTYKIFPADTNILHSDLEV